MRLFKKYKCWSKIIRGPFFPLRILKFKNTKWKKIKKKLLRIKKKFFFIDHSIISLKIKFWDRIKNFQKKKIIVNNILKQRNGLVLKSRNDLCKENFYFINKYLVNEYRIDIILYNLQFFVSLYETRQYIKNGFVLVNNKVIHSENNNIKSGDIIFLSKKIIIKPKILNKELKFSFLEVDYYTQIVVILKNIKNFNHKDIFYNFTEKL